jgi:hypothetical protein
MEQLVARRAHNPKVTGSSPVPATKQKVDRFTVNFFCFIGFLVLFVNSNRFRLIQIVPKYVHRFVPLFLISGSYVNR